jgi:hypothetical protein
MVIYLYVAVALTVAHAALSPLACGLLDTSRWVAKTLAPLDMPEGDSASQFLKFGQAALLDGWPSNIPFVSSIFFFSAIICGFAYRWWAGFGVYFVLAVASTFTRAVSGRSASYYIALLYHRMSNRSADYKRQGDTERFQASQSYCSDLEAIMALYMDSGLKPPTPRQLKQLPYGNPGSWLDTGSSAS